MLAAVLLGSGIPSLAQQRPLKTDDADIVPTGRVRLEFGVEFLQGQRFSLSGLEGDLTRLGVADVHVGVGEYAEFQISGVVQDFLSVSRRTPAAIEPNFAGDATSDVGDLVLATKLKLMPERKSHPGVAFKFAVQLPNAETERRGIPRCCVRRVCRGRGDRQPGRTGDSAALRLCRLYGGRQIPRRIC